VIGKMIVNNFAHRPVRTLLTVLGVGFEVMLVVIVVGLTTGMIQEVARRVEGVGADILLQPPASSVILALSGAPMPIALREKLEEVERVTAVAPVLVQFHVTGGLDVIYGIEAESFDAVSGGFLYHAGRGLEEPYDVLVDDWYAGAKGVAVGQTLRLLDHDFRVAGIVEHGKGARIFIPLATMQELLGARDKASLFFIKNRRAEDTPAVMESLRSFLPRYEIRPLKDYLSLMTASALPGLDVFVRSMIALAVAIGFLVIFLAMYTAIVERTREIGVLKSLGASRAYITRAILSESLLVCLAGVAAGVGLSYLVRMGFNAFFPTLTILITPDWVSRAAALAVAAGLLGALYPAWLAARKDAVEALAYE
jgi:putative ABC transport system permease protein